MSETQVYADLTERYHLRPEELEMVNRLENTMREAGTRHMDLLKAFVEGGERRADELMMCAAEMLFRAIRAVQIP